EGGGGAGGVGAKRRGDAGAGGGGNNTRREERAGMGGRRGEPLRATHKAAPAAGAGGGFRCQRPGCMWGSRAHQLPGPPMNDDLGRRIYETVCAECWNEWLRNFSIKVINELRLDLSTEHGQEEYDRYMREFLGIE